MRNMAVRLGVVLSGVVVVLGVIWSVWGYSANPDNDVGVLFVGGAIVMGGIALAVIWLAVFVVIVIQKGIRVIGDGRQS